MSDEGGGESLELKKLENLGVQALPGHLIERAERLVEEKKIRVERERPGQRNPHFHAARKRPRVFCLEPGQPHGLNR